MCPYKCQTAQNRKKCIPILHKNNLIYSLTHANDASARSQISGVSLQVGLSITTPRLTDTELPPPSKLIAVSTPSDTINSAIS